MMPLRPRGGYTLLIALLAITAIGMLVVSLDLVTRTGGQTISGRRGAARVNAAAVSALSDVLDQWPVANRTLAVHGSAVGEYLPNGEYVRVVTTREDSTTYRFDLQESSSNANTWRVARGYRRYIQLPYRAALVTLGPVSVTGNAVIAGADFVPENTTLCNLAGSSVPNASGVAVANTAQIQAAGWAATWVPGGAQIAVDPGMTATSVLNLGNYTATQLTDIANITYPDNVVLTGAAMTPGPTWSAVYADWICDNLGQPVGEDGCERHFPVIYVPGRATLSGVRGQGVLITDGRLTLTDSYFYGIVINRGGGVTLSGASRIAGQVLMTDPTATFSMASGELRFSSCAINRVNYGRVLSRPALQGSITDLLTARAAH